MKIIKIEENELNNSVSFAVVVEYEGYKYSCICLNLKPSKKEIEESFEQNFNDGITWIDHK